MFYLFDHNGPIKEFATYQANPSQLLSDYKMFREVPPSAGLQKKIEDAVFEVLENYLLDLHFNGNLSRYHFIKLLCISPKLINGREDIFQSELSGFLTEIGEPRDKKILSRAKKIANWINEKPLDPKIKNFFFPDILSSEGIPIRINRFAWAYHIPALLPMFIGNWYQHKPWGMSRNAIQFTDEFINIEEEEADPEYFTELTVEELLQIFKETDYLQVKYLKWKISELLTEKLTPENILDVTTTALHLKHKGLTIKCFDFLYSFDCGLILQGFSKSEVSVQLNKLKENDIEILKCLFTYLTTIQVTQEEFINELYQRQIEFPNVTTFCLEGMIFFPATISRILKLFPNAKKWSILREAYDEINPEDIRTFRGIEILNLIGNNSINPMILPPNLKLLIYINQNRFSIKNENGVLVCNLNNAKDLSALSLDAVDVHLTDQSIMEFADHYRNLKQLYANKYQLEDKTVRFLAKRLPNLIRLDLNRCVLKDETVKFLIRKLKELRVLSLNSCALKDETIRGIVEARPWQLIHFELNKCNLTDETVKFFAEKLWKLERLTLNSCKLEDKTVLFIAHHLKNLKILELKNCPVSLSTRVELESLLPNCSFHFSEDSVTKKRKLDNDQTPN